MSLDATMAIHASSALSWWNVDLSPDAYDEIDEVFEISGLAEERPEVPRTPIDRTSVERIAGLNDGGEVTINLNRTLANSQLVAQWYAAGDEIQYRLESSDSLNETQYFTLIPRRRDFGSIRAENPGEIIFVGRISGAISTTNPHA